METGEEEYSYEEIDQENMKNSRIKQMILDENFKKAQRNHVQKNNQKKINIPSKKRPFLHSGIILIVFAIICIIIIDQVPWFYLRCDSQIQDGIIIEEYFFKGFESRNEIYCSQITQLFEYQNGTYPIGLSINDFDNTYSYSYYSFIAIAIIGLFFTILMFLNRFFKFSNNTSVIIQTVSSAIPAFICIILLIIFIRFLSGHLLFYHNSEIISNMFSNVYISFPTPLLIILILAFILKIQFTIMKLNYGELEKRYVTEKKSEQTYNYRI
jgi:hypothetical protein